MQAKGFNHYVIFIASAFTRLRVRFGGDDFRYDDFGGRHCHERALPRYGPGCRLSTRRDRRDVVEGHVLVQFVAAHDKNVG